MNPSMFSPVDFSCYFNAAPAAIAGRWHPASQGLALRIPHGLQRYWGVPFILAAVRADPERHARNRKVFEDA